MHVLDRNNLKLSLIVVWLFYVCLDSQKVTTTVYALIVLLKSTDYKLVIWITLLLLISNVIRCHIIRTLECSVLLI